VAYGEGGPSRRRASPPVPASTYLGLGLLGVALFFAGVVIPVLASVPYADYVRIGVAAAGGFLAMFGLGRWYEMRHHPRGRGPPPPAQGVEGMPSLEFFSPPKSARRPPPPPDDTAPRGSDGLRPWVSPRSHGPNVARWVSVAAVLFALLFSAIPVSVVGSTSVSSPAGVPVVSDAAPLVAPTPGVGAVPVCVPPGYPVYAPVHGLFPPLPMYSQQSPCKVTHDEVHATFSSPTPNSGERVEVPIGLPTDGHPGQSATYGDFYVGMVVKGNASSVDGQSYAEVVFTPRGHAATFSWNVSVAVWSLVLNTTCSGSALNLTFDHAYACEVDEVGNGDGIVLASDVPGGQATNVTMTGSATSAAHPLEVYFNDSTNVSHSGSFVLSQANTHTDEFQPYYVSACPDACILNWSMPFGLGVGVDLCDSGVCFSYNQTALLGDPPFEVGSPEFWTGLAYAGDYLYLSPESSTGACSGVGSVAPCDPAALSGYYPYFSFNGTILNFGANWSWATEDWGGAVFQFNGYGTMTDFVPLFLDEYTNSSRAGYVAPGVALNVSVRAQDLGTVTAVNFAYTQPGGTLVNTTASRTSGTASNGIYAATVPATGANGTISFRISATNGAGAVLALPPFSSAPSSVVRSKIPTFHLILDTSPPSCGGISVNGGATNPNGSETSILAGTYSVRASSCYPYRFAGWSSSAGDPVTGSGSSASVTVGANGTLTASWTYARPVDAVTLAWTPSLCGAITINGQNVPASASPVIIDLLDNGTYSLGETSCGGHSFSGWTVSNAANLSVLGDQITVLGNGTLTETSLPTSGSLPVVLETNPVTCGGILVQGAGYTNNESLNLLANTPYAVGPDACDGYGFNGTVTTTANLTYRGGELTAQEAGTVSFSYYKLTLVTILTSPGTCGGVLWDGSLELNGAVLNVTNHTLHSIAGDPCSGSYLEGFDITGGLIREGTAVEVDGPGTVQAVYRIGTPEASVGFITSPAGCGSIDFDGTGYSNAGQTDVSPGSVATLSSTPCSGYGLVDWVTSGGITVRGATAFVNFSGSIEDVLHPLVDVIVDTSPANCGSVLLQGSPVANGGSVELPVDASYTISAVPCLHDTLESWETSTGAGVANGTLTLGGSAIITAVFVAAEYPVTLGVEADGCGFVELANVQYTNNSTIDLTAGAYPIASDFCVGYEFSDWATGGALNISGTSLIVNGAGNVTEVGVAVPPSVTLVVPSSAGTGSSVILRATVAVPVPPYDYNFTWSFGDGSSAVTPSNFTSHAYASTGTYLVTVTVTDPLGRTAVAESNVTVVAPSAPLTFTLSPLGWAVIGLAAALVVLGAIVSVVRTRRAADARRTPETGEAPPEEAEYLPPPQGGGGV
jgi:hypothetical protein